MTPFGLMVPLGNGNDDGDGVGGGTREKDSMLARMMLSAIAVRMVEMVTVTAYRCLCFTLLPLPLIDFKGCGKMFHPFPLHSLIHS